jgi:hypothetical protein
MIEGYTHIDTQTETRDLWSTPLKWGPGAVIYIPKFHKDWFSHLKVDRGGYIDAKTHRQHDDRISLLLFCQSKESRMIRENISSYFLQCIFYVAKPTIAVLERSFMPFVFTPKKLSTLNFPLVLWLALYNIKEQTTFKNETIKIYEGFARKIDNECLKFEMAWGGKYFNSIIIRSMNTAVMPESQYYDQQHNVKWVPCHQGTARPWVADRDELQLGSVAANIMNKQSLTADKGRSFSLGVGRRANSSW